MRKYQVVDAKDEPVAEPFDSERKAYEAKDVYRDHCTDVTLPLRVVEVDVKEKA